MKKFLSIALCAATVSAFADPTETQLGGEIGVTAITTSLSNAIVAVSYDDLAGGSGMVYSNLVKTTNLTVNDKLIQFGYDDLDKGKYTSWVLKERTSGGAKYWEELTEAYKDDSGLDAVLTPPAAGLVSGAVGTGIWLVRQNPLDAYGNTNKFYIYGKPAPKLTTTLAAGKWNLVGNPTQGEVTITNNMVSDVSDYDQLVIPVAPSGKLCYYTYLSGLGGWRTTDNDGQWTKTDPKLDGGLGCWIKTKNGGTITWGTNN